MNALAGAEAAVVCAGEDGVSAGAAFFAGFSDCFSAVASSFVGSDFVSSTAFEVELIDVAATADDSASPSSNFESAGLLALSLAVAEEIDEVDDEEDALEEKPPNTNGLVDGVALEADVDVEDAPVDADDDDGKLKLNVDGVVVDDVLAPVAFAGGKLKLNDAGVEVNRFGLSLADEEEDDVEPNGVENANAGVVEEPNADDVDAKEKVEEVDELEAAEAVAGAKLNELGVAPKADVPKDDGAANVNGADDDADEDADDDDDAASFGSLTGTRGPPGGE